MKTAPLSLWNRLIALFTALDAILEAAHGSVEGRVSGLEARLAAWDAGSNHIPKEQQEQS